MDQKFSEFRESDKSPKYELPLMLTCVWIKINLCRDREGNVMSCINFHSWQIDDRRWLSRPTEGRVTVDERSIQT